MAKNGDKKFDYREGDFICVGKSWNKWADEYLSEFDKRLQREWSICMDKGIFRYKIESNLLRVVPGKYKFILQSNPLRGQERRKPESIHSLSKPFDPSKFNFTKINKDEIMFNMCPLHSSSPSTSSKSSTCDITTTSDVHPLIINVSPIINNHVLLIPQVNKCHSQRLTQTAISLSLDMILLSSHPGFRILFNSLCALASVNHQHVHALYLNYPLYIDHWPVKFLYGPLHEIDSGPTTGFVLQLAHSTADQFAKDIHKVISYLQKSEIAHNMVMTRGVLFGESENSDNTTIRAYIWPRKPFHGDKSETGDTSVLNVAAAELGGHVPMYAPDIFETLSEEYIVEQLQKFMLPLEEYDHVKKTIVSLFTEHNEHK